MTTRADRLKLQEVLDAIPASLHTVYAYAELGRWSSWLTRYDELGRRGRHLLVDVPAAIAYWRGVGRPHVADRIAARAAKLSETGRAAGG